MSRTNLLSGKVVLLLVQCLALVLGAAIIHFGFKFGYRNHIPLLLATTICVRFCHGLAMGYCFNLVSLRISTRMNYDRESAFPC
jgi:nitrate/nitrite transporter NarK